MNRRAEIENISEKLMKSMTVFQRVHKTDNALTMSRPRMTTNRGRQRRNKHEHQMSFPHT